MDHGGNDNLERLPIVVAKVGSRGAVAFKDGQFYAEPAFPVELVDSTGAGDNFNAGFLFEAGKELGALCFCQS